MKLIWYHEVSYLKKPVYEYQDFAKRLAARGHEVEVGDFNEQEGDRGVGIFVSRAGTGTAALSGTPHCNWPAVKYFEARMRFRQMLKKRQGDVDGGFVYSIFINATQAVKLAREGNVPMIYRILDACHRLRTVAVTQTLLKRGQRSVCRNAAFLRPWRRRSAIPSTFGRLNCPVANLSVGGSLSSMLPTRSSALFWNSTGDVIYDS